MCHCLELIYLLSRMFVQADQLVGAILAAKSKKSAPV